MLKARLVDNKREAQRTPINDKRLGILWADGTTVRWAKPSRKAMFCSLSIARTNFCRFVSSVYFHNFTGHSYIFIIYVANTFF